jgi:hypothetical protein
MRRVLIFLLFALLGLVAVGSYWWKHSRAKPVGVAYIGERQVTLWSSTAQVREPVVTLHYGQRVAVLATFGDRVQIRSPEGAVGWVDQDRLIAPELWQRRDALLARARSMPVEASGHTRVRSNVHVEPGRLAPVIAQMGGDTAVEVLARAVARREPGDGRGARAEDWLLVRAHAPQLGELAGWVLGRFVALDAPPPLPDYAAASAMRIVAWHTLGSVSDPRAGTKPFYLVAGTRGPEGEPCDFTMLRVYTWSRAHQRYETAYVEDTLCGVLPLEVAAQPSGDYLFHFTELTLNGKVVDTYRMRGTMVRRAGNAQARGPSRRRPGSSPGSGAARR